MARPRKKRRTQNPQEPGNARAAGITKAKAGERTPQSMVIRMGGNEVGTSVSQLVKDMREVMQPHTAGQLRERRGNKLRDFTTMAGPLGVTHFLLFSKSEAGNTSLRLAVTPRGPTLGFRIEKYSLAKDVARAQRRPKTGSVGNEHLTPPLLVMNNFNTPTATAQSKVPKHLEQLTTSVFQSLFPPISPNKTPLSSIRRVLLVNRERSGVDNEGHFIISLRHYAITSKPMVKLTKGIKRLLPAERHAKRAARSKQGTDFPAGANVPESLKRRHAEKGGLPNMGRLQDIADYVLDPAAAGYTSASDTEADTDAEVEVLETDAKRVLSRRDRQRQAAADAKEIMGRKAATKKGPQKRAIKLTEIGPRMKLRLVKVEEGLCSGKVMWHEFYEKTEAEQRALEVKWEKRRSEKEERRRIQKENIMRKRKESGNKKDADEDEDPMDVDDLEDEDWDDFDGDEDDLNGDASRDDAAHEENIEMEDESEGEEEMEEEAEDD